MNLERLKAQLKSDEGMHGASQRCSVCGCPTDNLGIATIGYGRNVRDNPLNNAEAEFLMDRPINDAVKLCKGIFINFDDLNDVRQEVLVNMAYNLGSRLEKFIETRKAVAALDWAKAANQMRASLWFAQVGLRGIRLANAMESGEFA